MQSAKAPGFSRYVIREDGQVTRAADNHVMKPHPSYKGRLRLHLISDSGCGIGMTVHRLVALAFLPKPSDKHWVLHRDGNHLNNHVSNLYWGNKADNVADSYRLGEFARGERVASTYIAENDIRIMKWALERGAKRLQMAKLLGIPRTTIVGISTGHTWKHADAKLGEDDAATAQMLLEACSLNFKTGEGHPSAKLSESQVTYIRLLARHGYGADRLARWYGVAKTTMRYALNGATWSHIEAAPLRRVSVIGGIAPTGN